MRISDWSSDVCSSDLLIARLFAVGLLLRDKFTQHATSAHRASIASIASQEHRPHGHDVPIADLRLLESDHRLVLFLERIFDAGAQFCGELKSEENTSELQSIMRTSDAGFCLKKQKNQIQSN